MTNENKTNMTIKLWLKQVIHFIRKYL